jgi:adenosylhomocysteine nucleosidase
MTLGIMGAIPEEILALTHALGPSRRAVESGKRTYHVGTLWGHDVVLVFSRCGKVAAASTATHLIAAHHVDEVMFVGVAGAVSTDLRVGDIVVARALFQHDMDARPIFARHEIPLLHVTAIETEVSRREAAAAAANRFVAGIDASLSREVRGTFGIRRPSVLTGDIASGDQFFANAESTSELRSRLPSVLCVEMEGAAVGQVCHEYGVPFTVVRTISDSADHAAPVDFPRFIAHVASVYSLGLVREVLAAR